MNKLLLFEDYYNPDSQPFCDDEFILPLGVSDDGKLEEYKVTDVNRGLLLVSGNCGSGKSNYLHTLLNAILFKYSSQHVSIWLYEYKGCEFRDFANRNIPHITNRWIGDENNENEALVVSLEKEIKSRQEILMKNNCANYDLYLRNVDCCNLPRLVVIMDEFDMLINELFHTDINYQTRLDRIFRMAHAFGITLICSVQSVARCYFPTVNALSRHIAMRQEQDSIRVQFNDISAVMLANTLSRGEAIIDTPSTRKIKLLYISRDTEQKIIERSIAQ